MTSPDLQHVLSKSVETSPHALTKRVHFQMKDSGPVIVMENSPTKYHLHDEYLAAEHPDELKKAEKHCCEEANCPYPARRRGRGLLFDMPVTFHAYDGSYVSYGGEDWKFLCADDGRTEHTDLDLRSYVRPPGTPNIQSIGNPCLGTNTPPRSHTESWFGYFNSRHNDHLPPRYDRCAETYVDRSTYDGWAAWARNEHGSEDRVPGLTENQKLWLKERRDGIDYSDIDQCRRHHISATLSKGHCDEEGKTCPFPRFAFEPFSSAVQDLGLPLGATVPGPTKAARRVRTKAVERGVWGAARGRHCDAAMGPPRCTMKTSAWADRIRDIVYDWYSATSQQWSVRNTYGIRVLVDQVLGTPAGSRMRSAQAHRTYPKKFMLGHQTPSIEWLRSFVCGMLRPPQLSQEQAEAVFDAANELELWRREDLLERQRLVVRLRDLPGYQSYRTRPVDVPSFVKRHWKGRRLETLGSATGLSSEWPICSVDVDGDSSLTLLSQRAVDFKSRGRIAEVVLGGGIIAGLIEQGVEPPKSMFAPPDMNRTAESQTAAVMITCQQIGGDFYTVTEDDRVWRGKVMWRAPQLKHGYSEIACLSEIVICWGEFTPEQETK